MAMPVIAKVWMANPKNDKNVVELQPHLAPFVAALQSRALEAAPGRCAELISMRVGQILHLPSSDTALEVAVGEWYASPDLTDAEKVVLEITEQFLVDVHGVTDEMFAKLKEHFTTPEILAILFHVALCDGFGKLNLVTHLEKNRGAF